MSQRDNPFRGARPFRIGDQKTFFGRSLERKLLLSQVLSSRIVVVHAPTGTGKSSLINASLIPELRRPSRNFVTPPAEPFRPSQLFAAQEHAEAPDSASFSAEDFSAEDFSADDVVKALVASLQTPEEKPDAIDPLNSSQPTLILVDQLEEIFTTSRHTFAHQEILFNCLGELSYRENLWMVLVVREDYLAQTLAHAFRFCGGLRSRFAVPLLTIAAARGIIEETLEKADEEVTLDQLRKLSEAIAHASQGWAGENLKSLEKWPIIEPLILQLLCKFWVDQAGDRPLKEVAVPENLADRSLVDHVGSVLSQAAQQAGDPASEANEREKENREDHLRQWCEEHLIEGTARRQAFLPEREAALTQGLASLLDSGFLAHRSGGRVELTHDRFVPALNESNHAWYRKQRNVVANRRRQWVRGGKQDQDLLALHEVLFNWREIRSRVPASHDFVAASLTEFWKRVGLLAAFLALIIILPLSTYVVADMKRQQAVEDREQAISDRNEAKSEADQAREDADLANAEKEDARLKSEAMSLSQKASLLGESNSADRLALTMALEGFKKAHDKDVVRGSHAKALARSVLIQRVNDPAFLSRSLVNLQGANPFNLRFDESGNLWVCGANPRWLGNPFAAKAQTERRESVDCNRPPPEEILLEIGGIRFVARDRHLDDDAPKDLKFALVESVGEGKRGRTVRLDERSVENLRALAGIKYPTLGDSEELPVRSIQRIESADEDYLLGLSVTKKGAAYLWRIDTENALHCLVEPVVKAQATNRDLCKLKLFDAAWMTRKEPVAAWIASDGSAVRVASKMGEVSQIEIHSSSFELRPSREFGQPITEFVFTEKSVLVADQLRLFRFRRDAPESLRGRRRGYLPSCERTKEGQSRPPFFPKLLTELKDSQTIIAIGRDGCLAIADTRVNEDTRDSELSFKPQGKIWNKGEIARLIVDIRDREGETDPSEPLFLVVNRKDRADRIDFIKLTGDDFELSSGLTSEDLAKLLWSPREFMITSIDVLGSYIAIGGKEPQEEAVGVIALCHFQPSRKKNAISACQKVQIGQVMEPGRETGQSVEVDEMLGDRVGGGVQDLAFSPSFPTTGSDAKSSRHAFLAAATTGGTVHVYALELGSLEPDERGMSESVLFPIARLRSHVPEALAVDWADHSEPSDRSETAQQRRTQLLASVGQDGLVSITEVPEGRAKQGELESDNLEQTIVPMPLYRHQHPLGTLRFDGERLFVGGEYEGSLQLLDLRSDRLIERACNLLLGADWQDSSEPDPRRELALCRELSS